VYTPARRAVRRLSDHSLVPPTDEQVKQSLDYSLGSIRNEMVHMMKIDQRWFCGLRGGEVPGLINPVHWPRRDVIRQQWDEVEGQMREYRAALAEDTLHQPFAFGMQVWEVLFHGMNHGTDHRAQALAMLHRLGTYTRPRDCALFAFVKL
jgi:uncharacterized damage-inducible protein DinB